MASKIQFKRGSTSQSDAYLGAEGEVIINTTKDTIVVHDGVQTGGYEIIHEDLSNISGSVPSQNIVEVDCGVYGSGLFAPGTFNSASLLQTLDNPNPYGTSASDQFGMYSVATSGNYAIVGARGEDDASDPSTGRAYIFNVSTGALIHTLINPNAHGSGNSDEFGYRVAISGNYAIVGARGESSASNNTYASGKAYIFNVTTGALLHTLDNPNPYGTALEDQFSSSVAMSGDYAIIGAYAEDDGGSNSGTAYIFNVSTGALVHTLDNPNAASNSYFGYSIAISGNTAIVGSFGTNSFSGKAYIFNVSTGALLHTLDNPNAFGTSAGDRFGQSVAMSGNYAIVGAWLEDDAGGSNSGTAYIFNVSTGALVHTLDNPNAFGTSASDNFGWSIAMSDSHVIVGAYLEDDAGGTSSGKAYIFDVTTGALLQTLDNPNAFGTSDGDKFGRTVDISDNYIIIGTFGEDDASGTTSGKAYIYEMNIEQGAEITAPGAPTIGLASVVDHETVTVAYTAPSDNGHAAIESYTAISSPDSITATLNQEGSGTITVTGLNESTEYTFTVTATNSYTTGDPSNASNSVVTPATPVAIFSRTLDNPNNDGTSEQDRFGQNIAISDNYMLLSAEEPGSIFYLFDSSSGSLERTISNPDNKTGMVALTDDYAVIGSSAFSSYRGRIHVFNRSTGVLTRTISSPESGNYRFGGAIALSGDYLIAGTSRSPDGSKIFSGKAYIYNVSTGALLHTLDNPNAFGTSERDGFGGAVAISGNYAIVGAYQEDDAGGTSSGKAYIYNVSTGALLHTLDNPNAYDTSANDDFGYAVGISGNYAIVGAIGEDDAGGTGSGKAYIFDVTTGAFLHTLDNPNAFGTSASDRFGHSVAITDSYAIVSAYVEADASGTNSGTVYIFDVTTGALLQTINNPNAFGTGEYDYFGYSVVTAGNYVLVSASGEDEAGAERSGKAYVYTL